MKVGEGAGKFIADCFGNEPTEVIRQRWKDGEYGTGKMAPRADYVRDWMKQAGRNG